MAAEKKKKRTLKTKEITFNCKFCEHSKPLAEMVVLTRFSPPIVACQDCEKRMQ